ncbi:MAG: NAD(P)H-dependent flavin oxidoreductase [Trueperaceae bacterium]
MLKTPLCNLLNIDVPIIQAPFGPPALVAAIAETGALGHTSITWRTPDEVTDNLRDIQALTSRSVAVNLVSKLEPTHEEARLEAALNAGANIITFHWADGFKFYERIHNAGAKVIQLVTSTTEAKEAERAGADALVVQGWEAGGHVRSEIALMSLLPNIVDSVKLPVIAAGGIADGRGIAAALALGASGVWLGTRFLVVEESGFHEVYKQKVIDSSESDTVRTFLFDSGWPNAPHRVLRNSTIDTWEKAGQPQFGHRPNEGEKIAQGPDNSSILRYDEDSPKRDMRGNIEAMALYAGQSVGLVNKTQKARDIVKDLIQETIQVIRQQQQWIT